MENTKLVPRHEFQPLAKQHHEGHKLRKRSRWSQFVSLGLAQLSGRSSFRNMRAQVKKLYHLGVASINRSSLVRVNEQQPYTLYEALFGKLFSRCQGLAPKHDFGFKNTLYSLDALTIDLCLSVFPWATSRRARVTIKLHVGIYHDGYLPAFVTVTGGTVHDVTVDRTLTLPKGSVVVFDCAYTDYTWYNQLNSKGIFFVTQQKSNATL